MLRLKSMSAGLAIVVILAFQSAHAGQRAFVASFGSDANTASSCGLANPCRGFAAAMTVVDPGGEILALDAAGYGVVTIDKSVSLIGNTGFYAGITVFAGTGVNIATPGVNVILRGLNINGLGGSNGVIMSAGSSLSIENCVISNFTGAGIGLAGPVKVRIADTMMRGNSIGVLASGGAALDVANSRMINNSTVALLSLGDTASTVTNVAVTRSVASQNAGGFLALANTAGATARLSVTHSMASNNDSSGIRAETQTGTGTAIVVVGYSTVTQNDTGLAQVNSGSTLISTVNNVVELNTTDTVGTITNASLN